jgi:hypothetical protein
MIVGDRSPPDAVTWHSSIKQERPCSIRAGNGRRVRLSRLGILRGRSGRGQCPTSAIASLDMTGFSSCGRDHARNSASAGILSELRTSRIPVARNVACWHKADVLKANPDVCFRRTSPRPAHSGFMSTRPDPPYALRRWKIERRNCYKGFGSFGLTKPPTTPVGAMRPVTPHSGQGCRQNLAVVRRAQ